MIAIVVRRFTGEFGSGEICAAGFSKIWHHAYRKTAANFYRNSIPILQKAIYNALHGPVQRGLAGVNQDIRPTNIPAIRLFTTLAGRTLRRIVYGVLFEKKWNVLIVDVGPDSRIGKISEVLRLEAGRSPQVDARYAFYADPFFSPDGSIVYAEALSKSTGLGEIVALASSTLQLGEILLEGRHFSYPQSILTDEAEYLFPETAGSSSQHFVRLGSGQRIRYECVKGLEAIRLVDATYFRHRGLHFIFASGASNSMDNLRLFFGESRLGPYREHPMSPIVIDPTCARMAGSILEEDGRLYRFGQNNAFGYGGTVWLCEINELTSSNYRETKHQEIKFEAGISGPHTINFSGKSMVVDFYVDRFAPLAGLRRLRGSIGKRRRRSQALNESVPGS
jgi:hypothetical protein